MSVEKKDILGVLEQVQDPDLGRDIVSLGFVKNVALCDGVASVTIELTTPACPAKDEMQAQAKQLIEGLEGIKKAEVTMTAQVRSGSSQSSPLLPQVKNIIPVASGKGGVGKSTVAANLALALHQSGASVGLLDADVYGPSIPTIMGAKEKPAATEDNRIIPSKAHDIKVLSMGFFLPENKAVIWRGPMLDKTVTQFMGGVEWGELDYLVIDLPPGTGDVQLSLCQKAPLTGAVVVSTPQDVALNVAQKAIFMFQQLNTPVLGIVENMTGDIFGRGGAQRFGEGLNIPYLGDIPLSAKIRQRSDSGEPVVVSEPDSEEAAAFRRVAESLAAQISIRAMSDELEQDIKVSF
ncbi:MAG TPA: Mrp/NBP35 family ATP-binding protein [Acidobacteriota bacterium]|nr:Mrp/NBP35 family ATP-binding protein [Acidobacteriota bacterium]